LKEGFRAYELYFPFHVSRDRIRAKLATRPALRQRRQSPDFSATSADLQLDNLILKSGDTAFSAQIPLGCRIALTGPSGAGKSLLLETLAGLRLQYKGNILVGGHDLDHYNTASVRKIFGFCSPRLPIPRGKPKKLLSYRHPQTDVAQRQAACAWAGLEDESRELVKGNILSRPAGLQLRMKLARALLGMPRILLLDEMDAGADEKYLATLQHLLKAYPGTVIFVAHHPALTAAADEVWQFDNGRIDVKKRATQPQIRIAG